MKTNHIPYQEVRFFSSLINDYTTQNKVLKDLYHHFPTVENFKHQIAEKQSSFDEKKRAVLVKVLEEQYATMPKKEAVSNHIKALALSATYTVTTGHQLCLFTGPLYFLYKIISTVNTTRILSEHYPQYTFVPVYWMASEDHDFQEINHFYLHGKKICWHNEQGGMTGNLSTEMLKTVYKLFSQEIGLGKMADYLKSLFEKSYLKHSDLASATRYLVNELFGEMGVVVVDGQHKLLKKEFVPYIKEDLLQNTAYQKVNESIEKIQKINKNYPIQVNPRPINLFYLTPNARERIVYDDGTFSVLNTSISMNEKELFAQLDDTPERFSPNVIMRPLYQEVILPNLAYIGGGGEIAYWLELKNFFKSQKVPFPILMLRNSVLLVNKKQKNKKEKLQISYKELFFSQNHLKNLKIKELSDFPIDFSPQRKALQKQFSDLLELATRTDKSFENAVKAQEKKQLKGLNMLEKRLLKAQKRKFSEQLQQLTDLQNELFPNGVLQERHTNFSEFYAEYGELLLCSLAKNLNPFDFRFTIIEI